ncbi:MAG: winged helix-turn-helix domain-containing protein [bacterium]|nr:winged helix-turn-helix domain-containing protein [bacterium]
MELNGNTINGLREFANFRLDVASRVLWSGEKLIELPPRAIDVLCVLTERPGEVVSKRDLIDVVWQGSFVEDSNLTHQIYELRRTFRENGCEDDLIQTVSRRGYRFVSNVEQVFDGGQHLVIERTVTSRALIAEIETRESETKQVALSPKRRRSRTPAILAIVSAACLIAIAGLALIYSRQTPAGRTVRSLAVMPLQELGDSRSDRSVLLGMTYALISQLGSSADLAVRPLSSSISASAADSDPIALGKRLGVDSVVEWYLQTSGGRSRVNVRLIEVEDGRQLWTESFDYDEADLFKIQEAIADRTAGSLLANLTPESLHRNRPTANNDAYQAYLRGRYHWNQRTREGFENARGLFEQAISLDPKFGEAHAGLADVFLGLYDYGYLPADRSIPFAAASVNKALELSPNLSDAYSTLASIEFLYNRDWTATEQNFNRAIELAPNDPTPRLRYGWMLSVAGRAEAGLNQLLEAEKLDPTSNIVQANIAYNLMISGRLPEAADRLLKLEKNAPNFSLTHWYLGTVYFLQGKPEQSLAEYFTAYSIDQGSSDLVTPIRAMIDRGDREGAFRTWREDLEKLYREGYFPPSNIALVAALAKDREHTMEWLRESERLRDPWMLQILHDPEYRFLKGDTEFEAMLEKMSFGRK